VSRICQPTNSDMTGACICLAFIKLHSLTLPLSGRQGDLAISADSTVACPLEGLVRRCRFFTGKHGRPLPRQQRSSHLRFTSHTCAQLQSKSRDDLQDGVKAGAALSRVGLIEALPGETLVSGHLSHSLGSRDVAQSLGNESRISIRLQCLPRSGLASADC